MPNLVLGVSGSISCYRAADLARDFMRAGFDVRVCLTDAAERFVSKPLFETLTGNPCLSDVFEEPIAGRMAHIDWAKQADVLVIAPATANTIDRIGFGLADDMLTTIALVFDGSMVVAPAMNPTMYANPTTQEAVRRLEAKGVVIVEPTEGDVVSGEEGAGKLALNADIVTAVQVELAIEKSLAGKKVLITSGPTQESIDDVRFLSNRSSGKMGAALAQAALKMGAEVTVVSGPVSAQLPNKANVVRVRTALEMLSAAREHVGAADLIIGAAAVADYRPANAVKGKIRRSNDPLSIDLVPNPDIIAELAKLAKPGAKVIGFAAEPSTDLETAKEKLMRKGLFAIAHNDVSDSSIGFESDENSLTLAFASGETSSSGKMSKLGCSKWLIQNAI